MRLTTSELRDLVAMTMVAYLRESEGTCALEVERVCDLVKWVDAHDFEASLEAIREDNLSD